MAPVMSVMLASDQDGVGRGSCVDAQLDDPGGVDEGRVWKTPVSNDVCFSHA
jgi:hypothetical protein